MAFIQKAGESASKARHFRDCPPGEQRTVISVYDWVESMIFALIFGSTLFVLFFHIVNVSGSSMEPNLRSNDRVLLTNMMFTPKTGDVVVITHSSNLDEPIIKRVIATGGQSVDINFDTGIVFVDGEPLDESAYIKNGITVQKSAYTYPLTVPPGHLFVLGDNRGVSNDSRNTDVGMVDERYVMGKARMIIFPMERMGKIK